MRLAPLVSSMSAGKGLYVPLIGSGVSTGAGIPTGHQIMLDLLGRLASLERTQPTGDLEGWFEEAYHTKPTYPAVLEKLSHTPGERAQLLKGYFEPTEDERALGRKLPTKAHRALARLAKRGIVRLVLTTNFDALIEQAMRGEDLEPIVVTRADDLGGLPPLSHLDLCVVKLHGDYRDLRTLNSAAELASYDAGLDSFIRRVLSDYGLIVCGWSAEYDAALLRLVKECQPRNYGTYWTHKGPLGDGARDAISARGAMVIEVPDADALFHEIAEGLSALERTTRQVATGADITLGRLKTYLQAADRWIDLDELVTAEVSEVVARISGERFRYDGEAFNANTFVARVTEYEANVALLNRVLIAGAYWGRSSHDKAWLAAVQRVVPDTEIAAGNTGWIDLADYPALLAMYSLGLGAIAGQRADLAVKTLTGGQVRYANVEGPWAWRLHPWFVGDTRWFRWLPGLDRRRAPVSERVWQVLKPLFGEVTITSSRFDELFDDWELLLSLTGADLRERAMGDMRAPVGRFSWNHHSLGDRSVLKRFRRALDAGGANWEYVKAGLCGGDPQRVRVLLTAIEQQQELGRFYPG